MTFIRSWLHGDSQLMKAAAAGDSSSLCQLINEGADVNFRNSISYTALHRAAYYRHVDCMRILIDHGADIHARSKNKVSVLHSAAVGGSKECVQMLIEKGCDINAQNIDGRAALYYAKWGGNTKCIKLLNDILFSNGTKDVETIHDETNRIISNKGHTKTQGNTTLKTFEVSQEQSTSIVPKENEECQNIHTNMNTIKIYSQNTHGRVTTRNAQHIPCTECKCKMCFSKWETFNSMQQVSPKLNKEAAEIENRDIWFDANDYTLIEKISALESRIKLTENFERQSRDALKKSKELHMKRDKELDHHIEGLEKRIHSIEQSERGYSSVPHVVTLMAGFNISTMVGQDYMQPQMKTIFNHDTFRTFREFVDPVSITDYLWENRIISERQYQEIKGYTTDIGKAEYLWLLMKQARKYLDSVRRASIDTNQDQIATLLEFNGRLDKEEEEVVPTPISRRHIITGQNPKVTKRKQAGGSYIFCRNGRGILSRNLVFVALFVVIFGILVRMFPYIKG